MFKERAVSIFKTEVILKMETVMSVLNVDGCPQIFFGVNPKSAISFKLGPHSICDFSQLGKLAFYNALIILLNAFLYVLITYIRYHF